MRHGARTLPGWEGRDTEAWAEWLGCARLELRPSLPSTNDRARELAREGAPPFSAVVAAEQTRGRGRGGSAWHSAPGGGLWMSVLLPGGAGTSSGVVPIAVGVAAAVAVEEAAALAATSGSSPELRVGLKWPNDLVLGGRKLGGILCEAAVGDRERVMVAGIGVNLRRPPAGLPVELENRAAFLEEAAGEIPPPVLAREIMRELRNRAGDVPERVDGGLRRAWSERDWLAGREVACEVGPRGIAEGIGPDGALRVRAAGGEVVEVRAGEVRRVQRIAGPGEPGSPAETGIRAEGG